MNIKTCLRSIKREYFLFPQCRCSSYTVQIKAPKMMDQDHIYQKIKFKNNNELADFLHKNIIFNENYLIAVNKPYGLKRYIVNERRTHLTKLEVNMTPSAYATTDLSLEGVLPFLAKMCGVKELIILKVPERYNSGVALLGNHFLKKKLENRLTNRKKLYTYVGLCVGIPRVEEDEYKFGATLVRNKEAGGIDAQNKRAVLVNEWTHTSVRKGKVRPCIFCHKVISRNDKLGVSLVQVTIDRNKWHSLRLFYSTRLFSPVLGDNIYGHRISYVNGVPLLLNPFSPLASIPQKLSKDLLSRLSLKSGREVIIPLHLHLSSIQIPKLLSYESFNIKAPLPDYFQWSCDALDLDTGSLNDCDNILPHKLIKIKKPKLCKYTDETSNFISELSSK